MLINLEYLIYMLKPFFTNILELAKAYQDYLCTTPSFMIFVKKFW